MKFILIIMSIVLFGCASKDDLSVLEARVSNLELADKQTNKEIELLILNEVDIQYSIDGINTKLDRIFRKK